jgi:hypothetical protein
MYVSVLGCDWAQEMANILMKHFPDNGHRQKLHTALWEAMFLRDFRWLSTNSALVRQWLQDKSSMPPLDELAMQLWGNGAVDAVAFLGVIVVCAALYHPGT